MGNRVRVLRIKPSILAAGLLMAFWVPQSNAETTNCTAIMSLPAVITTQGIYCFTGHLQTTAAMTSGNAIEIQVNNVTIDLNGFKLGGLAAGDGTLANGIYANQRKNINIKNGIIRGFYRGVHLQDVSPYTTSSGHEVETLVADGNTRNAILVQGSGNTIRANRVVDTGSSTQDNNALGISIYGPAASVRANSVSTTTATSTGNANGIKLEDADGAVIENNRVIDTTSPSGTSRAIHVKNSSDVIARGNNMINADQGLNYNSSTGKYFNNLTSNVTTPFPGTGTPIGGNNN